MKKHGGNINECVGVCVFNKPVESLKQVLCIHSESLFILVSPLSGKTPTETYMYDTISHEHISRK